MTDKNDMKEKIREIYGVLPKLDDRRCGYETCGEFARAVAEGRAPCYGCVSGGPVVAAKVCEIMGAKVPEQAVSQFDPSPGFYQSGLGGGRGMGMGMGRGMGRGMGMGMGRGMGRGMGMRAGMMPPVSPTPQSLAPGQDIGTLKAESQMLSQQLSEIQRRIEEMERKGNVEKEIPRRSEE